MTKVWGESVLTQRRVFRLRRARSGGASFCSQLAHGLLALVSVAVAIAPAHARPVFVDVTADAGIEYIQQEPPAINECIFFDCEIDRMSGGAAVGDYDGDGDLDLYVTRLDQHDLLFRNNGDGTFTDRTLLAGLRFFDLQSNGAAFVDVDNDGDQDLYVTVVGLKGDPVNNRNYLFVNTGLGGFIERGLQRSATEETYTNRGGTSVAAGDYDRDGWVDLHVTEWLTTGSIHARLWRNLGESTPGHFENKTNFAGVNLDDAHSFASTFTDVDRDGWPDLLVAGDFDTSRLFWNDGDGTFTVGTDDANVGTDENGMGSTVADFDGDGLFDWFITSISDPEHTCPGGECWGESGNRLYRNLGDRTFEDITSTNGVRNGGWGWGTAYFDYDNDGDLDLVMTAGMVMPDTEIEDTFNDDPIRLWENGGEAPMVEVAQQVGLVDTQSGKGLLVFDYNDDGQLDLMIVNNSGPPKLYENQGEAGNGWLRVKTQGTQSSRDGHGAILTLLAAEGASAQVREVGSSSHFLAQSERTVHFGLGPGADPVVSLVIDWPSGAVSELSDIARNQEIVVIEPAPEPALALLQLAALVAITRMRRARRLEAA